MGQHAHGIALRLYHSTSQLTVKVSSSQQRAGVGGGTPELMEWVIKVVNASSKVTQKGNGGEAVTQIHGSWDLLSFGILLPPTGIEPMQNYSSVSQRHTGHLLSTHTYLSQLEACQVKSISCWNLT